MSGAWSNRWPERQLRPSRRRPPMPLDLDKLERLEREATPGPWRLKRRAFEYNIFAVVIDFSSDLEAVHGLNLCRISELDRDGESNLDLLIALRNAAPALIAELRAARE